MIENTWCIDWLSSTFKDGISDIQVRDTVSFGFPKKAWVQGTPHYGYAFHMGHPFGHSIMSHPGRPEMGVHLSFTGRSLRSLSEGGITALSMLEWVLAQGGRVTRIDLAIDVLNEDIDIIALAGSDRMKENPGSARKWNYFKGHDGGCTAYIGSRKSEKFLRIYDKAAEQGLKDVKWTRFELEIKGDAAKEVALKVGSLREGEHAAYIKGVMRALFNPQHDLYQRIMDAPAVVVTTNKDTDDNTLEWLMNSVAKTVAKTALRRSDLPVMADFLAAIEANYQALLLHAKE